MRTPYTPEPTRARGAGINWARLRNAVGAMNELNRGEQSSMQAGATGGDTPSPSVATTSESVYSPTGADNHAGADGADGADAGGADAGGADAGTGDSANASDSHDERADRSERATPPGTVSAVVRAIPAYIEPLPQPELLADTASADEQRTHAECRSALRVLSSPALRRRHLRCLASARSFDGQVRAYTLRRSASALDVLSSPPARRRSPERGVSPTPAVGGASLDEPSSSSGGASADEEDDAPPPTKAAVEGLHARFLLEGFERTASLDLARLRAQYDALLAELSEVARYLGLAKASQSSLTDQLAALSVLREFSLALARCAQENAARDAESSRHGAKQQTAPGRRRASQATSVEELVDPLAPAACEAADAGDRASAPVAVTPVPAVDVSDTSPLRYCDPEAEYF